MWSNDIRFKANWACEFLIKKREGKLSRSSSKREKGHYRKTKGSNPLPPILCAICRRSRCNFKPIKELGSLRDRCKREAWVSVKSLQNIEISLLGSMSRHGPGGVPVPDIQWQAGTKVTSIEVSKYRDNYPRTRGSSIRIWSCTCMSSCTRGC